MRAWRATQADGANSIARPQTCLYGPSTVAERRSGAPEPHSPPKHADH